MMSEAAEVALIATIAPTVAAVTGVIMALINASNIRQARIEARLSETKTTEKIDGIHGLVNSKMTELNAAISGQAHAEGMLAGKAEERALPTPAAPAAPTPVTITNPVVPVSVVKP